MAGDAMRVTVFTTIPPGVYSGGRYLSLMLAYSLARAGADVTYVTNNLPLFDGDFAPYEQDWPVRKVVSAAFDLPGDLRSDWVVVIPTGSFDSRFYNAALDHARRSGARVALLSFETPNWYNALSPFPRSPMPTESWRQVVAGGGLVISIAAEGVEPARRYFGEGREGAEIAFCHWHPPINDLAAAHAAELEGVVPPDMRRRVAMFARIEDPHKGAQDLLRLPPDLFEGHLLSLVFGRSVSEPYVDALRRHFAPARDFAIEVHSRISDEAKFRLLARSRLLLFPSYFEGFGYPPVEAAWMGAPTVAYDLPLLREVAGGALRAVPVGDTAAFAEAVREALVGTPAAPLSRGLLTESPDTLSAGQRLLDLLADWQDRIAIIAAPPPAVPIPRSPPVRDPFLEALAGHHQAGLHLLDVQGEAIRGVVRLRGRIAGGEEGDRVRFSLADASLPETPLRRLPDGTFAFEAEGLIARWPETASAVTARCCVLRAQSRDEIALGGILVRPDWPILLERPVGARLVSAALPEAQFAADPARLVSDPLEAAVFAELSEALRQRGWRTRLLLPKEGASPDAFPSLEMDLLPQVDRVELLSRDAIASRLAAAADAGLALAGSGLDRPDGWNGLHLVLRDGNREGSHEDPMLLGPGIGPGQRRIEPDARLARRSLAAAGMEAVVLLLPAEPITTLPPGPAEALCAVEPWVDRLRIVVPRRLWGGGVPPCLGMTSAVEILPEAELAPVVRAAGLSVGISLGEGDSAGALLLRSLDRPILDGEDAALTERLRAAIAPPAAPESSLAALLPDLLPRTGCTRVIDRIALDRDRREPTGGRPVPPPALGPGDILSLTNMLPVPAGLLVAGWKDRDMYGARMAGDSALLAIDLAGGVPPPDASLEVLLRPSGKPDPALAIWVLLNGQPLGRLAKIPAGVSSHVLRVPKRAWSAIGPQGIVLAHDRPWSAEPGSNVTLMALTLRGSAEQGGAWPAAGPSAQPRAPLAPLLRLEKNDSQSCRFGKDAPPGFVQLLAGWSDPETDMVWSDGTSSVLGFQPPLASGPVLLRLDGHAFVPPGASGLPDHQRIRLRAGSALLGLAVLERDRSSFSVVVPDMADGQGVDYLLIEYPDARRPADFGLSSDRRLLGLALRSATAMPLKHPVMRLDLAARQDAARTLTLPALAGALRISGSGAPPAGLWMGDRAGTVLAAPMVGPEGGWEAWLALDAREAVPGQPVTVGLLGDTPSLRALELWCAAEPAGPVGVQRLLLFGVPLASDPDDVRGLVSSCREAAEAALANATLDLPARFDFTLAEAQSEGTALLADGWSSPEPIGTWSDGSQARLALPVAAGPALARIDLSAFVPAGHPAQSVVVSLDGRLAVTWRVGSPQTVPLVIPDRVRSIGFAFPDALSPAEAGQSSDSRRLGMLLRSLDVEPLTRIPASMAQPGNLAEAPSGIRLAMFAYSGNWLILRLSGLDPAPWGLSAGPGGPVVHPGPAPHGGWEAFMAVPGDASLPEITVVTPPALLTESRSRSTRFA